MQDIDAPGLQQGNGGDPGDKDPEDQVQDRQVPIGARFQGRISRPEVRVDREAAIDPAAQANGQQSGAGEDGDRGEGRPQQEFEAAFDGQGPNPVDAGDVDDREDVPDIGETAPEDAQSERAGPGFTAQPQGHRSPVLDREQDRHQADGKADKTQHPMMAGRRQPKKKGRVGEGAAADDGNGKTARPDEQVICRLVADRHQPQG